MNNFIRFDHSCPVRIVNELGAAVTALNEQPGRLQRGRFYDMYMFITL